MVSKIEELRNKCLEILKKTNDLKEFQKCISFDEVDKLELEQFIKLCDNRLDRLKTFRNEEIIIFGFGLTALSIELPVALESYTNSTVKTDFAIIMVVLLIVSLLILFYRLMFDKSINGWTSFKEQALMEYPDKK